MSSKNSHSYSSSFSTEPLLHVSSTEEERIRKFEADHEGRISDSMQKETDIIKLLNSKGRNISLLMESGEASRGWKIYILTVLS